MKKVSCSCGYVASAQTAEELLTAVEAHIAASHGAGSGDVASAADQWSEKGRPPYDRDEGRVRPHLPVDSERSSR
jgi:hypothetical protein